MKLILISTVVAFLLFPFTVIAQDGNIGPTIDPETGEIGPGFEVQSENQAADLISPKATLAQNIKNIYDKSLGVILTIAFLVVIFAGYTYLTSFGNQEKINQAKVLLIGAVTGVILLLMIPLLLDFLGENNLSTSNLNLPAATGASNNSVATSNNSTVAGSASNKNAQKIIDAENSTNLSGQCSSTGCARNVDSTMDQVFGSSGWSVGQQSGPTTPQQVPTASELNSAKAILQRGNLPEWHIKGEVSGEHWILLLGIDGQNNITFWEPNGGKVRTEKYDYQASGKPWPFFGTPGAEAYSQANIRQYELVVK